MSLFPTAGAHEYANQIIQSISFTDEQEVNAMLDKFDLNWQVNKQGLFLPDGKPSGFYGAVRQDKGICFETCKEGYQVFQNSELAELVLKVADNSGYSVHAGGMFNEGRKVFLQLSTNEITGIGQNNDNVKGFATALNSHDGSMSLRFGHSNTTISCRNTFNRAAKQLQNRVKHTETMHGRIDQALRELDGVLDIEKTIFETFFKWAAIPTTREMIVKVVKDVTEVDITKGKAANDVSGYKMNRANELTSAISAEMNQKGPTLWGLFSGVTKYTSHIMPAPVRAMGRTESKMAGSGLAIDNSTYEMVEKFATDFMLN